jgi:CelD/BcsL family acetyltransferase involved in cellulose biosynthesis
MSQFETHSTPRGVRSWRKPPHHLGLAKVLRFDCLTDLNQISEIRADWCALEQRSLSEMAYFQSFDWCFNWCQSFANRQQTDTDVRIFIYTARRDDTLVMLIPLMVERKAGGLCKTLFIGQPLTQYGGALIDKDCVSTDDILAFWSWIKDRDESDVIILESMPATTQLATSLEEAGAATVTGQTSMMDVSGFNSASQLQQDLKPSTRRSRKRRRKKLASGAELELNVVEGGTQQYRKIVERGFIWKRRWLGETGRRSEPLSDPRTERFLSNLEDGALALVLERDGAPVAMEVGFLRGGHFYSYLGAFDYDLYDLSPGKVELEEALNWMVENNHSIYDLLGNPSTYKQHWTNIDIDLHTAVHAQTVKGYLYAYIWHGLVRPAVKRAFYALPIRLRQWMLPQADTPQI